MPLAHATDAAGSTRVPAACCGLVGLKTTRGATPTGPDFGNHLFGIASELVISRSVRDTAAALDVLAGRARGPLPDPDLRLPVREWLDTRTGPLRIGVLAEAPNTAIAPERAQAVRAAADFLRSHGHPIAMLDPAVFADLVDQSQTVFARVIAANFARNLGPIRDALAEDDVSPLVHRLIEEGVGMSAATLYETDLTAARVAQAMWDTFTTVDVLLTPMLSSAPPEIGAFPLDHDDTALHWKRMSALAPYAALANVAGIPALTLPHGVDAAGLPTPVQLMGPMGSDGLLLRLGRLFEKHAPWSFRHPLAGMPPGLAQ
ncbi:6-aminohexanoate-cyclic-dimer hydrolase [Methylobrevis pamukkalensis]|uniref:6-aminohexanoate-cyclic-dimer hydrolase n=1 Tax=Methylobrevis pamukkalensis TaxID=1439726 RepID=A0A1E3H3I1_9HYPH|nr:amidase [Methylobrevis pamukkalensis]ODN70879.1 6-aminohexanoate-cyclic-dimer hydrolase [Methylobrevis pamukkalensis]